ncbi:MAG: hypothetical protein ACI855_004247, partial [Myxococcota bacterium]
GRDEDVWRSAVRAVRGGADGEGTPFSKPFDELKRFADSTRVVPKQLVLNDPGDVGGIQGFPGVSTVGDVADYGCSSGMKLCGPGLCVAFGTHRTVYPGCQSLPARGYGAGALNVGVGVDEAGDKPAISRRTIRRNSWTDASNYPIVSNDNGVVRKQPAFGPDSGGSKGLHEARPGAQLAPTADGGK